MMLAFIQREKDLVLWSHGNYKYEIAFPSGVKHIFESTLELAIEKLIRCAKVRS